MTDRRPRYQNLTKFDIRGFNPHNQILEHPRYLPSFSWYLELPFWKLFFHKFFLCILIKTLPSQTLPGTCLDIFDGLVVMISACQDISTSAGGEPTLTWYIYNKTNIHNDRGSIPRRREQKIFLPVCLPNNSIGLKLFLWERFLK